MENGLHQLRNGHSDCGSRWLWGRSSRFVADTTDRWEPTSSADPPQDDSFIEGPRAVYRLGPGSLSSAMSAFVWMVSDVGGGCDIVNGNLPEFNILP